LPIFLKFDAKHQYKYFYAHIKKKVSMCSLKANVIPRTINLSSCHIIGYECAIPPLERVGRLSSVNPICWRRQPIHTSSATSFHVHLFEWLLSNIIKWLSRAISEWDPMSSYKLLL